MCDSPIEKDGVTFACRKCNSCLAVRRWQWVARAMAEKAMHKTALAVTLTYDNSTAENRDSAAMFNYRDIQLWLKKVREDLADQPRKRWAAMLQQGFQGPPPPRGPGVRYLIAGEQGERTRRCHWHCVLFSDGDLLDVGTFTDLDGDEVPRADRISRGQRKKPMNWSTWGRGRVLFQEPDASGMNYALSYVLKDQFTGEVSEGRGRYHRSENFATGFFRMSKKPPIGSSWLEAKFGRLAATGSVLPTVQLKIPGLPGYWVPSGLYRKRVLRALRAINEAGREANGNDAPQWAALVAACADNEHDLKELGIEQEEEQEDDDFGAVLSLRGRERERESRIRETVRRCGGAIPCDRCLSGFDTVQLEQAGIRRVFYGDEIAYEPGPEGFRLYPRGAHPLCQLRGTPSLVEAFPGTGRAEGDQPAEGCNIHPRPASG